MMLTIIDFWLLGRLEKFYHFWHKLTGKNCFWLARAAAVCYGLVCIAITSLNIITVKKPSYIILLGVLVFIALFVTIALLSIIKHKEQIVLAMRDAHLSNPFKIIDCKLRIVFLLLMPTCSLTEIAEILNGKFSFILIFTGILGNALLWYNLSFYFSACDPLPPAKSKIKEWKEKFVNAVKVIFAPAPQPSPVPSE